MQEFKDDHRGHAIFTHASGPSRGPWVASYSAWKIEPNNSYRAAISGTLSGVFQTTDKAHGAGMAEAKRSLDALLDKE